MMLHVKLRGSITFWVNEEVIEQWRNQQKTGRKGASNYYSDVAIATMGTIQSIFHLAGRQAEGFLESLFTLMRIELKVPDHSTLSRRLSKLSVELPIVGIVAAMSFKGGNDKNAFETYINQVLVPNLWEGASVVMDNFSSHKVAGIKEAIESAGAHLIYLSPYSPDFSPIENFWSKVKEFLRSQETRTYPDLDKAITDALETINLSDIVGWFKHCGYCIAPN